MARSIRIGYPGARYHEMVRGIGRRQSIRMTRQRWIADQLSMKGAANVSLVLHRRARSPERLIKPAETVKENAA